MRDYWASPALVRRPGCADRSTSPANIRRSTFRRHWTLNRYQKRAARFALLVVLLVPGLAAARLGLGSSRPARGDTLRTVVSSLQLTFTQRIELRFTSVMVVIATGDTIRGEIVTTDTLGRAVELRLSQPLLDGHYVVLWRTAGADGHAVTG